jgi:DNA-binding transcriptional regulator YhcF (GntR family)
MSEQNGKDPNEYFFKIHYYMVKTEAWLSLSTPARAIYIQICSRYITNKNNGKLAYSVRDAVKECRIDKKTAIRAFKELVALGFIEKAKANNRVSRRNATEWRLTAFDCNLTGAKASRAFLERGFEAIASRQSRQRPRPAPRAPQPKPKQAVRTVRTVHTRGGNDYPLRGKRLPTKAV